MRSIIITAVFICLSSTLFAQYFNEMYPQNFPPDLNWEFGINGGASICVRPVGPPESYCGTRTNVVGDYSINISRYLSPKWQVTLNVGNTSWASYGTWALNGNFGKKLNAEDITFNFADHAINESAELNYVIPIWSSFQVYNKANIYFGVMLGMINTINDGSQGYAIYKTTTDSGYKYVNKVDYNSGTGFNFGTQIGINYYFVPKLGFNIELDTRYAYVRTSADDMNHDLKTYYLVYFPCTFGIRYKL